MKRFVRWKSRRILALTHSAESRAFTSPAAERPTVSLARATSGDTVIEPDWSQRITITVGLANADIVGATDRALQAAVDYVTRLGGGTVRVLPGTYRLRNAVYLQ